MILSTMPLKGSDMGAETTGRRTLQRARLSDITNTTTASFSKHRDENHHSSKVSETQLHKDLATLKKIIAEKEEIIEAQKENMEKLWTNYTRKTKQNEDIIQQNARLFKDLMHARDRSKILQHENVQMAAAHKVYKSELQAKLAKALERADNSQNAGTLTNEILCDKQATFPNVLTKLAESRGRRTISTYEAPSEPLDHVEDEGLEHPGTCRLALRRRASLSYREPSLKAKLRQPESGTPSQVKPCINRRGNRIHQLHKVCEEDPINASIAMPCNSEGEVIESFLPPLFKSASQATSDSSCALPPDMPEDQISLSSLKSEEMPCAASATCFQFGDHFSIETTGSASIPEDFSRGRPSRRSVSCISSYKEAPLNTKMRRPS